ncbi:MAG: hypothetical protein C0483_08710 [Pirellula sp.]|nr:hypothetical protein [Pirellula sp.]
MNDNKSPADSLSPEKMQLFLATLAHLPPQEIQKAKLLYIRNAIAEFRALESTMASFGQLQGCMSIIPIFWPIISMQKKMMNTQVDLARQRITNAIDVWQDDLRAAGFDASRFDFSQSQGDGFNDAQRF